MSKKPDNFLRTVPMDELTRKHTPTAISLFSGCGGAALGLRGAGFEIRVFVEWEKAACNTLRANWINRPRDWREQLARDLKWDEAKRKRLKKKLGRKYDDALDFTWERANYWWQERKPAILNVDITKTSTARILKAGGLQVGEADILEGGFPCQGFSLANSNQRVNDPRNALYKECVRVIHEALPRTFILENVPGLASMAGGKIIRMIMRDLAGIGYNVQWDIHNAADYGVPQNRRRVIIIGLRNDVMLLTKKGRMQLHMGGLPGKISHPEWFLKKYGPKKRKARRAKTESAAQGNLPL